MPIREHIYKAKRKDNGEWIEGYYAECDERAYIMPTSNCDTSKNMFAGYWLGVFYEVIPETVCEGVGIPDKNGKKIFEGDILSYIDEDNELQYISVVFLDCAFLIDDHRIIESDLLESYICLGLEVSGNIYDNPELLEVKE